MWTHPPLEKPSVFIAAPGDVERLRRSAAAHIQELKRQAARDHGITVYDWTREIGGEGFDDWRPAQSQIPLPSDPLCQAVVCVFGERIGTPLRNVDLEHVGHHAAPRPEGAYRLVAEWPDTRDEAIRVAESGGFALTGTVFECLAALHTNQVRGGDAGSGDPPLKIFFVGDPEVVDREPNHKAGWGDGFMYEAVKRKHVDADEIDELSDWLRETYRPQVLQLRNFVRYLREEGADPVFVHDDTFDVGLRPFLRRALRIPAPSEQRDPFKGLRAYDVDDRDLFFGRETDCDLAVRQLEELWQKPDPTFLGIVAGSGVGKSSFLRAGLVGHLCDPKRPGRYRYHGVVVTPGDLVVAPGDGGAEPLLALFRQALLRLAPQGVEDRVAEVARTREDLRPSLVARLLEESLGDGRLLVALDQFEEVVDQHAVPGTRDLWQPLIDFIGEASRSERIGVLYTIQSNRMEAMEGDPDLGPLCSGNGFRRLTLPASLERIIREPFRRKRVELEEALVQQLESRMKQLADGRREDRQASLMPLVSLALTRIYEQVARPALESSSGGEPAASKDEGDGSAGGEETDDGSEAPGGPARRNFNRAGSSEDGRGRGAADAVAVRADGAGRSVTLTVAACRAHLDVETAIADLAEEALAATRDSGPDWSDDTLAGLLDRLVRPGRNALLESRFVLPSAPMPDSGPRRRLAEAMVERRILVPHPERPDQVRLVHEAVLHHWEPARKWLESRRDLMELEEQLAPAAAQWHEHGRPASRLKAFHLDPAAELLARRGETWRDPDLDSEVAWLRDYGLALLRADPQPTRVIARTEHDSLHLELAAQYRDADLARQYVETDPECVHATRSDHRTALFAAAFVEALEVMEVLLDAGADPEHPDEDGWRPIHAAAAWGAAGALRMLRERGASATVPGGPNDITPLHLAALNGHTEVVAILLEEPGQDLDRADSSGWTPLHNAAHNDNAAIAGLLLEHGADPESTLAGSWTPLHIAANHQSGAAARILVEAGGDVDARLLNDWTPLHIAARDGSLGVIEALLAGGAAVNAVAANAWKGSPKGDDEELGGWTPLHLAAEKDRPDVVRLLLAAGADPHARTADGRTPLHVAAEHATHETVTALLVEIDDLDTALHLAAGAGRAPVVEALIEAGADPAARDESGRTPLHLAVRQGHEAVVRVLAELVGPHESQAQGEGVLQAAIEGGHLAVAQALLDAGWSVDAPGADGFTPLQAALASGEGERVGFLLDAGADPGVQGPNGTSALHIAAARHRLGWIERLVERGGDPAAREIDGSTPLHLAALHNHPEVVERLIELGADPAEPDPCGWTPLHRAAWSGAASAVRVLLRHGAEPGGTAEADGTGGGPPTPLQLAAEVGDVETVQVLLEAGAVVGGAPGLHRPPLVAAVESGAFEVAELLLRQGAAVLPARDAFVGHGWARERVGDPPSAAELAVARALAEAGAELPLGPEGGAAASPGRGGGDPRGSPAGKRGVVAPSSGHALLEYGWRPAPEDVVAGLLEHTTVVDGALNLDPERTRFEIGDLPWYGSTRILRLSDPDWADERLRIYYLADEKGRLHRLNGTSPPVHEANAAAPIRLDSANVIDYLRFFCFFVRGEEGPFLIAESVDDPLLPRGLPPTARTVLEGSLRPASYEGRDAQGRFLAEAVVFYADALFTARFHVTRKGMVQMLDDEPIAADLPVRIEAPIGWTGTAQAADGDDG